MFQTKSGSRFIATFSAAVIAAGIIIAAPSGANAASLTSTDNFLKSAFKDSKYIEGFTPGQPDFGFSLEGLLQRKALGEGSAALAPSVAYLLQSKTNTGTTVNYTGYLFNKGALRLGQIGKWAFVSKIVGANNLTTRRSVLASAMGKMLKSGDLSADSGANTYDRAWLVLGLEANGYKAQAVRLANAVIAHQITDGGWDDGYTLGESSPDGTGLVLQALAAAKKSVTGVSILKKFNASIAKGVAYLNGSLVGGDHYESWGDYNINGTAYAAMGLNAVGKPNASIKSWLTGKLASDGGLQSPWSGGAGDVYATAQGAVALLGSSYAAMIR